MFHSLRQKKKAQETLQHATISDGRKPSNTRLNRITKRRPLKTGSSNEIRKSRKRLGKSMKPSWLRSRKKRKLSTRNWQEHCCDVMSINEDIVVSHNAIITDSNLLEQPSELHHSPIGDVSDDTAKPSKLNDPQLHEKSETSLTFKELEEETLGKVSYLYHDAEERLESIDKESLSVYEPATATAVYEKDNELAVGKDVLIQVFDIPSFDVEEESKAERRFRIPSKSDFMKYGAYSIGLSTLMLIVFTSIYLSVT